VVVEVVEIHTLIQCQDQPLNQDNQVDLVVVEWEDLEHLLRLRQLDLLYVVKVMQEEQVV
jgi:hypothetical protein